MRKFTFTLIVVAYGIVASIVMLPASILHGLFGLFIHFWMNLISGIKLFYVEVDVARMMKDQPFSWEAWAAAKEEAQQKLNNPPEEPK